MLKLIRAFLESGVMENGLVSSVEEGTPQGGPLSPLLSNLVLDELDRELERRQHRFVRYADDCNIYVASERAGKRVMQSVSRFIQRRLKLKVNATKSAVARPQERKFLGFSFTGGAGVKRRIAPKALLRCKQRVRELTRRTRGIGLEQMTKELASYLRGWKGYFGYCQTPSVLHGLDQWIRRRLRSVIWKQKKRRSSWHLANSPTLSTTFPNAYFDSLGLPHLAAEQLDSSEPPYADPHVRWCGRGERATAPPMPIHQLTAIIRESWTSFWGPINTAKSSNMLDNIDVSCGNICVAAGGFLHEPVARAIPFSRRASNNDGVENETETA